MTHWAQATTTYLHSQRDPATGGYRSAIDGPPTGYATAYALLTLDYLGQAPADLAQFKFSLAPTNSMTDAACEPS